MKTQGISKELQKFDSWLHLLQREQTYEKLLQVIVSSLNLLNSSS